MLIHRMRNPLQIKNLKMPPGMLITDNRTGGVGGAGGQVKKRLAPQPPKPVRNVAMAALAKNKLDDSYSTMSTLSAKSDSPNSTVSEKSIKVKPTTRTPMPRSITRPVIVDSVEPMIVPGWIRIYCGPDRCEEYDDEDPNKVLQTSLADTVKDLTMAMDLPAEYTLWLQVGDRRTRRLRDNESPLQIQENYLRKLGFLNDLRRSRMGIDPDLKHLLRFHIGPAEVECCRGLVKSGQVEILKGLVSPQWKTRSMAIVGSKLVIFPGATIGGGL